MISSIVNPCGERLAFDFTPGAPERRDLVVIGHGLTSDKVRPWSCGIADRLAAAGIASVRIAFAGNGDSEGRFVDSTITKEVEDLGSVIDAFEGWRIAYVGHSMGGAVGLVRATRDDRLHALVSLAAIGDAAEFADRMLGHMQPGEPILEKEHCPFDPALRADLRRWGSLTTLATGVDVPWLLVHGTADDVVPPFHSEDVHAAVSEASELVLLDGADHSFSGAGLQPMLDVVVPWLIARLPA